jgi:hypothetical protein
MELLTLAICSAVTRQTAYLDYGHEVTLLISSLSRWDLGRMELLTWPLSPDVTCYRQLTWILRPMKLYFLSVVHYAQ